jgi:4'-phosphopantetheinyl transferase
MTRGESTGSHAACIYPVILAVSGDARSLEAKERIAMLSRCAREALAVSAGKSGVKLGQLLKTSEGVPLPFQGWHWSLTHKPAYVGAVVASKPIGIDIERVKGVSEGLIRRIADSAEWRLSASGPEDDFFRFWTAKEAVLKAVGVGVKGLSNCRVRRIDHSRMLLAYREKSFAVAHFQFDGHIAAVVTDGFRVEWTLG